jgi:hypothetical protein
MNINATKTLDLASSIGEGDIRCLLLRRRQQNLE